MATGKTIRRVVGSVGDVALDARMLPSFTVFGRCGHCGYFGFLGKGSPVAVGGFSRHARSGFLSGLSRDEMPNAPEQTGAFYVGTFGGRHRPRVLFSTNGGRLARRYVRPAKSVRWPTAARIPDSGKFRTATHRIQ